MRCSFVVRTGVVDILTRGRSSGWGMCMGSRDNRAGSWGVLLVLNYGVRV